MSTAIKPVKKRTDENIKAGKKLEADRTKKAEQDKLTAERVDSHAANSLRRKLLATPRLLEGNAVADGAPHIETITGDEEASKFIVAQTFAYEKPFIVTKSAKAVEIAANNTEADKCGYWLKKWHR